MRIQASSISSSYSASFSSMSTYPLASSANCISSSTLNSPPSSSSMDCGTRCEGLDLLVKAVLYVAGSMLVVPFTQRRVIRRRKRALSFSKIFLSEIAKEDEEEVQEEDKKTKKQRGTGVSSMPKKRNRVMALPSKYHDSVLQPWKRRTRRRKSIEVDDGSR